MRPLLVCMCLGTQTQTPLTLANQASMRDAQASKCATRDGASHAGHRDTGRDISPPDHVRMCARRASGPSACAHGRAARATLIRHARPPCAPTGRCGDNRRIAALQKCRQQLLRQTTHRFAKPARAAAEASPHLAQMALPRPAGSSTKCFRQTLRPTMLPHQLTHNQAQHRELRWAAAGLAADKAEGARAARAPSGPIRRRRRWRGPDPRWRGGIMANRGRARSAGITGSPKGRRTATTAAGGDGRGRATPKSASATAAAAVAATVRRGAPAAQTASRRRTCAGSSAAKLPANIPAHPPRRRRGGARRGALVAGARARACAATKLGAWNAETDTRTHAGT